MAKDWYKSGEWNAICDVCGFKRKSSELTERWDGMMVCKLSVKPGCFETRHPQELIRPPKGERKLPWTRPESPDTYWHTLSGYNDVSNQCNPMSAYSQAEYAAADCTNVGEYIDGSLIDETTDLT
jgi:hypothetical protein